MEVEKGHQVGVQGGNTAKNMRPFRSAAAVEIRTATAPQAQLLPAKKKRQPSAIASAGAVPSQGLLCCHRSDFGASGADDLVGGAEDFLGALFGYHFGVRTSSTAEPILHVTPAILGSLKAQRFTTKKRHGFRFDFAQTPRRRLSIGEIRLIGMA